MTLKRKILIVDDNEKLGKNLSDILEFKGYEVDVVCDGYHAIEAFRNNKFNIVLMDFKMPGINGIDTLKILREITLKTEVIIITAFAEDLFHEKEFNNVKLRVIEKPVDIDKLLEILENTKID